MEVEANLWRKIAELPATALTYDAVSNTVPTKTTSDTQKFQRGDCNLAKLFMDGHSSLMTYRATEHSKQ